MGGVAFGPPGALAGAVLGVSVAAITEWLGGSGSVTAPGLEARNYYARQIITNLNYGVQWAHVNAHNVGEVIPDTQLYMARNAEWAAYQLYNYQTAHGLAHSYNANYVLSNALVSNSSLSDLWQIVENYQSVFNVLPDMTGQFTGTYVSMKWGIVADGSQVVNNATQGMQITNSAFTTYSAGENGLIQLGMIGEMQQDGTHRYYEVSNQMPISVISAGSGISQTLHVVNGNGTTVSNITLSVAAGGIEQFKLSEHGLLSGRYSFELAQSVPGSVIFGILGADPITSNTPMPAMLVSNNVDNVQHAQMLIESTSSGHYAAGEMYPMGQTITQGPIIMVGDGSKWNVTSQMTAPFTDLWEAVNLCSNLSLVANQYAQTFYNQLVAANGDMPVPWADITFPDPAQLANMSPEQIVAAYYSYLNAMKTWFNTHRILEPDNINITSADASLLIRGTVYDTNGHELISNKTIYTPYFSTHNKTLTLGWNNLTDADVGFVCTWYNANTLQLNQTNTLKNFTYSTLGTGMKLHIEQILYQNQSVSSVLLSLHNWHFISSKNQTTEAPPQLQTDLAWLISHWYYIAAIAGAIALVAGMSTKSTPVLIVGVVLIIAAVVGWYLSSDHSLLSGLGLDMNTFPKWWK